VSLAQRRALTAYALLLVPLAFFLFIRILPTLSALQVAFYQWDMLSDDRPFVGLDNFKRLAQDNVFGAALGNTLKYVVLGVPTGLVLALVIALALARIKQLAGLFRTIYFIPFVTSLVAVSWVWRWLYQPQRGSINELLGLIGIPSQPFLQSTSQALPSIVAVNVWHDLGFQIVIFLAGLHAIPAGRSFATLLCHSSIRLSCSSPSPVRSARSRSSARCKICPRKAPADPSTAP
jgi:multiple sugar transport system permease protein